MSQCRAFALAGALLFWGAPRAHSQELPSKQSNIGDSISQAFSANGVLGDHPALSWVQGTDGQVNSVLLRFASLTGTFSQEPESVSGAELVGGGDNFPAQAARVCAQAVKPQYVSVLLGGNDVCNRDRSSTSDPAAHMYSVDTWTNALRAGLDQLAACLPAGATVQVLSMPRVDVLYEAGHDKGLFCVWFVWPLANICPIVTKEDSSSRRAKIGGGINADKDATAAQMAAHDSNPNGKNANGVHFLTDWQGSMEDGYNDSSIGTYRFGWQDINGVDCFHPNVLGQNKIACTAWATNPFGSGSVPECLR